MEEIITPQTRLYNQHTTISPGKVVSSRQGDYQLCEQAHGSQT